MRQRIPKLPAAGNVGLADVAVDPASRTQRHARSDFIRNISEPVLNHLREKLHKIRKKRASSDPVSLDFIRRRNLSLQNTVSFQIGQEDVTKKLLRKGRSLDLTTTQTDGNTLTQQEEETISALPRFEEREVEDSE